MLSCSAVDPRSTMHLIYNCAILGSKWGCTAQMKILWKKGDQLTVVGSNASTAVTGLQSATGLAEGCGLSVAGMMITNIVMHRYMSLRCPDIHMLSYVDNWEMNAETVEEVQQGMHQLERFCDLWDLQLDQSKTVYWSVNLLMIVKHSDKQTAQSFEVVEILGATCNSPSRKLTAPWPSNVIT